MDCGAFFEKAGSYARLSKASRASWEGLLRAESYKRGDFFLRFGERPSKVAFIVKGLLAQNYVSRTGDETIKYFFPEGRFAASVGAMLAGRPSAFSLVALEDTRALCYDFHEFRRLVEQHSDIASFYIRYMERHWIVEKEPLEISFRHDTAPARYREFLKSYPELAARLKKHHIASYLGVTPTQLSRILSQRKEKSSASQHM